MVRKGKEFNVVLIGSETWINEYTKSYTYTRENNRPVMVFNKVMD